MRYPRLTEEQLQSAEKWHSAEDIEIAGMAAEIRSIRSAQLDDDTVEKLRRVQGFLIKEGLRGEAVAVAHAINLWSHVKGLP